MGHRTSNLSEVVRNGTEIQRIIFIDENGKKQKKTVPREEILKILNVIYSKNLKWIEIKNIRGLRGKILKAIFEIKEITNKTCHFGPLNKRGD